MPVNPNRLSGLFKKGQQLPDLGPVFLFDLLFIGFLFSGEAGKEQLRERDVKLSSFIRQERNL